MDPTRKAARVAGFLYLGVVLTGVFVLLYVPGKLFVHSNAAATASNILAHETLFRCYIAVGLVSELLFILTALALYRLLRDVGPQLATLMVVLVLVDAPFAFAGCANELATLEFLRGGLLAAFDPTQRALLGTWLIALNHHAVVVSELFWGLWLLPLGILVYRSRFLPRWLGLWLFVNGIAYVAVSASGILAPDRVQLLSSIATPIQLGEVAFTLWLVIVGARPTQAVAAPVLSNAVST